MHLQTVLFDSGAIQSNYIDEQFVNNNIVHLKQFLQPLRYSVKLGDIWECPFYLLLEARAVLGGLI